MRETTVHLLLLCFLFLKTPVLSYAQPIDSVQLIEQGQELLGFVSDNFMSNSSSENIESTKKALSKFQKVNNWEGIIDSYNFLSVFYYFEKKFKESENYLLLAKDLAKKELGVGSIQYREAWTNLTTLQDFTGFKEEAIEEYKKIIIVQKEHDVSKASEALIFHNLGTAYSEIGEYEEAIDALNNAVRLRESAEAEDEFEKELIEVNIAAAYSDIAACYTQKNENDKAIELFKNSLNLLDPFDKDNSYINQIRYNCYYKLADIYLRQGDNERSFYYVNKAIEIKNKDSVFDDCYSYQILGKLNLVIGKSSTALDYFEKAIQSATNESDGFSNFPQIATAYTEKGNAFLQLTSFDQALTTFQKGLQITALDFNETDISKNPSSNQIIQKLGTLDLITGKGKAFLGKYKLDKDQNNLELASEHFLLASQIVQSIREGYNTIASKHILAGKANQIYEQAIEVCYLLFQTTNDVRYTEQAFLFAESNKSITLLESMTKETALSLSGIPDSLLRLEKELNIKLSFAENQLAENKSKKQDNNQEIINRLEQERYELKESYQRLIDKIEKQYPQYYQQKFAYENANVSKIQKDLLDEQTALIEYFIGEESVYSFLISKNNFKIEKAENTPALTIQINEIRQILSVPPESKTFISDFKTFTDHTHVLYTTLLERQVTKIQDEVKNLIIIPDGILGSLPFGVLLTEKANQENPNYNTDHLSYLMGRFSISYSYSSALFFNKQNINPKTQDQRFIAFAPSFNEKLKVAERTCSSTDLYSLKCSSEEVNRINENFNDQVVEGPSATKAAFLDQVSKYKIVHLATHACVNEENAMLHRIHFSDDYITPYDLYNLKLNADLVVLSACNTGTGKIVKGEGVMSLSRGFIQSGSASTLMSLWSVDDCATSDMMIAFYDYLEKGFSKSEALQKTKINYINSATDKAKSHPYYWAAFVQYGDTKPINIKRQVPFLLYGLAALCIIGILFFSLKRKKK